MTDEETRRRFAHPPVDKVKAAGRRLRLFREIKARLRRVPTQGPFRSPAPTIEKENE